jgi:hypothetical protein
MALRDGCRLESHFPTLSVFARSTTTLPFNLKPEFIATSCLWQFGRNWKTTGSALVLSTSISALKEIILAVYLQL